MKICCIENCDQKHWAKGYCKKHYLQNYYLDNKEKYNKRSKEYYSHNREKIADTTKEQKEKKRLYNRQYRLKNKERIDAKARLWRLANRDKILEYKARYRAKNIQELSSKEVLRYHECQRPRDNQTIVDALKVYDGKCQKCGCADITILAWHHREGNRKVHNESNVKVAQRVIANKGRLDDIMLLCANCHIHQDLEDNTSNRASRMREIAMLWGS